jgi:hypothetical protein
MTGPCLFSHYITRHGPLRKHRFQVSLYCCMFICFCRNMFVVPLPSRGYLLQILRNNIITFVYLSQIFLQLHFIILKSYFHYSLFRHCKITFLIRQLPLFNAHWLHVCLKFLRLLNFFKLFIAWNQNKFQGSRTLANHVLHNRERYIIPDLQVCLSRNVGMHVRIRHIIKIIGQFLLQINAKLSYTASTYTLGTNVTEGVYLAMETTSGGEISLRTTKCLCVSAQR